MQIQKVQSNQTNFGTKVYIDSSTKILLESSKAKRKIFNHINQLKNNGVEDVFVLKHGHSNIFSQMNFILGIVFEKRKDGIFKTPFGSSDPLVMKNYDKRGDKHANILQIYKEAKNKWPMREIDKNTYEKQLSILETI